MGAKARGRPAAPKAEVFTRTRRLSDTSPEGGLEPLFRVNGERQGRNGRHLGIDNRPRGRA